MPERRRKIKELRAKLDKYRALARMITDVETQRRVFDLTHELEQEALEIEKTLDDLTI